MVRLSDKMQERLNAYKASLVQEKPAEKKRTEMRNFVGRGDYGDDIRDFEEKDAKAWKEQCELDPLYKRSVWR
jgi:hypothetical protein